MRGVPLPAGTVVHEDDDGLACVVHSLPCDWVVNGHALPKGTTLSLPTPLVRGLATDGGALVNLFTAVCIQLPYVLCLAVARRLGLRRPEPVRVVARQRLVVGGRTLEAGEVALLFADGTVGCAK